MSVDFKSLSPNTICIRGDGGEAEYIGHLTRRGRTFYVFADLITAEFWTVDSEGYNLSYGDRDIGGIK